MSSEILARSRRRSASGGVRVVDLSQTLRPATPVIQLPPEFAQSAPFRIEPISHYDARGPGWYWNNLACGEHTGTHFDAPAHWVTGKDRAGRLHRYARRAAPGGAGLRDRLLARRRRPTSASSWSPRRSRRSRRSMGASPRAPGS